MCGWWLVCALGFRRLNMKILSLVSGLASATLAVTASAHAHLARGERGRARDVRHAALHADSRSCGRSPGTALTTALGLELIACLEYPAHDREAQGEKAQCRSGARDDIHVRHAVEAPAKAADQVDHRVEQGNLLPYRRQHADRVERAAEEGEGRDDHERHNLQLLEAVGPEADDETEQAEGYRRQYQEGYHPYGVRNSIGHEHTCGDENQDSQHH